MKSFQKGFTLIELMIVLAVIGIMAAMFIPRYQDYIARTQVSEGIAAADAAKIDIQENLINDSCINPNVDAIAEPNAVKGRYMEYVISGEPAEDLASKAPQEATGCIVTITYGNGIDSAGNQGTVSPYIKTKKLVLNQLINGSYSYDTENSDVALKYLPKAIIKSTVTSTTEQ